MSAAPIPAVVVSDEKSTRGCFAVAAISAGRLFVHGFVAFLLLVFAASLLHVADFYVHENLKIPAITALVWRWARWMSHFGLVVLPILLCLDAFLLIGLECLPSAVRSLARVWFNFVCVAVIVIMTFSTFMMVFPLKVLTDTTPAKETMEQTDAP